MSTGAFTVGDLVAVLKLRDEMSPVLQQAKATATQTMAETQTAVNGATNDLQKLTQTTSTYAGRVAATVSDVTTLKTTVGETSTQFAEYDRVMQEADRILDELDAKHQSAAGSVEGLGGAVTAAVTKFGPYALAAQVVTQALVGWYEAHEKAALAAETAGAKQDVINKAISEGAAKSITYADAIKYVNEQERHRLAMNPAAAAQTYVDSLTKQATAAMRTSAEEEARTKGLADMGFVIGGTVDVQKMMNDATREAETASRKHAAELKKAEEANERFRASVKNLTTDANGAAKGFGMYGQLIPDLSSNTAQFADQTLYLDSAIDKTKGDVEDLERNGRFLSVAVMKVNQELITLPNVAPQATAALQQVRDEAARGHNVLTGFADELKAVWKGMSGGNGIGGLFENLGKGVIDQFGSLLTGGISSLINKGIGLLASGLKRLFGGPSQQELQGRQTEADFEKQYKSTADMIAQFADARRALGDSEAVANQTATQWAHELWNAEKQGGDAVQAVIDKIHEAMDAAKHQADLLNEASGKYGPSKKDLEEAEKHSHELFDAMVKDGTFTQEQLNAAFYDWQKDLAAAGNEAAKAWLAAHDAATGAVSAQSEAVTKLQSELDSVTASFKDEAPEKEMGSIEKAARERAAELHKEIAAATAAAADTGSQAAQDAADAISGATDRAKNDMGIDLSQVVVDTGDTTKRTFQEAADTISVSFKDATGHAIDDLVAAGQQSQTTRDVIAGALGNLSFTIPVHFSVDDPNLPNLPGHAAGGVFSTPHIAMFAEGGRPEIAGPVPFMTEALVGALERVSKTGGTAVGSPTINMQVTVNPPPGTKISDMTAFAPAFNEALRLDIGGMRTSIERVPGRK